MVIQNAKYDFINCQFSNNVGASDNSNIGRGGGIYLKSASLVQIQNTTFVKNYADGITNDNIRVPGTTEYGSYASSLSAAASLLLPIYANVAGGAVAIVDVPAVHISNSSFNQNSQ